MSNVPHWVKLGASVWVSMHHRAGVHAATITKVGRKWVEVKQPGVCDARFRLDRMTPGDDRAHLDGGNYSSPGIVWSTLGTHARETKRTSTLNEIRKLFDKNIYRLTLEEAEEVVAVLRIVDERK